jgi:hypothetical protein
VGVFRWTNTNGGQNGGQTHSQTKQLPHPPPGDTRQTRDSSDGAGLAPQSPRRSLLGPQAPHHPCGLAYAFGRAEQYRFAGASAFGRASAMCVQRATAEGAIVLGALLVVANAWFVVSEEDLSG